MAALTRSQTNLEEVETTPFAHKYLLKRPRMLQRNTTSSISPANTLSHSTIINQSNGPAHDRHPSLPEGPEIDNPAVEKRRFELFIDLIWVGIISNLAERFSDQTFDLDSTSDVGENVFEFIVTFLIAWRIWKDLQEFMTKYHTNDLVERLFVVWILILAMLYGNNATFLFDGPESSNMAVIVFLIIQGSFLVVEAAYSVYIPPLRKQLVLRGALLVFVLPLWISATLVANPTRAGLGFAAIVTGYYTASFMTSPIAGRLLKQNHSESFDADHWVERIQDFHIIVLGEGVLSLIKGSPLGKGITYQAGAGILALLAYYVLSAFYFNGDQSRTYVHAVRRTWWRKLLWLSFHVFMSGSTLILGVSSVPLIQNPRLNAEEPALHDRSVAASDPKLASVVRTAKWAVSISLSFTVACQTGIALLSRSLDGKGSLKISNRYVRLLPRLLLVIIVICLPIDLHMAANIFLGIVVSLLLACMFWEWIVSLESDGGGLNTLTRKYSSYQAYCHRKPRPPGL